MQLFTVPKDRSSNYWFSHIGRSVTVRGRPQSRIFNPQSFGEAGIYHIIHGIVELVGQAGY